MVKTACIQINSGADMAANIARVEQLVGKAAEQGAQLVALPENVFMMRATRAADAETPARYTQAEHPGVQAAARLAKGHGLWLLAGSVAMLPDNVIPSASEGSSYGHGQEDPSAALRSAQDDKRTYNRSLLFNPQGEVTAQYDKIHLFDVEVGDGQEYKESAKIIPGAKVVTAPLDEMMLGLTVCYDLRFPHLYRALAKAGAQILAVPAAFTQVTGEAHWHVLLRARAIENGCYVIAPAQTGTHPGGRKTFGHSLVVDPWGRVLADAGTEEGVIMAELDMAQVDKVRANLPSLRHDREFD